MTTYLKESILYAPFYVYWFGGVCFINHNPTTMEYEIVIKNADIGTFRFKVTEEKYNAITDNFESSNFIKVVFDEYLKHLYLRTCRKNTILID